MIYALRSRPFHSSTFFCLAGPIALRGTRPSELCSSITGQNDVSRRFRRPVRIVRGTIELATRGGQFFLIVRPERVRRSNGTRNDRRRGNDFALHDSEKISGFSRLMIVTKAGEKVAATRTAREKHSNVLSRADIFFESRLPSPV